MIIMAKKYFKCDKCGLIFDDLTTFRESRQALEVWMRLCIENGIEQRGISPCPNFQQCQGELQLYVNDQLITLQNVNIYLPKKVKITW
jgi:hypothetical protein